LGLAVGQGCLLAALSMLGDLLSSFIKRRLKLQRSSMALGLDQVPEALLPLLLLKDPLGLTWPGILRTVVLFFVLELVLSRLLFWLRIRKTPY
jgi:CDP-2,3-bis-(O-geranylgeranyl)-sn-glycerol synthase